MWDSNTEFFFQLFAGLLWIAFWIGASVVYRKVKGKPLVPKKPVASIFFESSASGKSNRNFLTKLGGARNCLLVAVTENSLVIQPKFPFNLMFLPEVYGLEYDIPRKNIRSITEQTGIFGTSVTLEFCTSAGGEESVDLRLRRTDQFLKALKQG